MTTMYRPVLIETAEQAEALPDGTVLIRDDHYAFQKDKGRFVSADPHDFPVAHSWELTGWTALVPIEARYQEGWHRVYPDLEQAPSTTAHRYVTPWTPKEQA